MDIKEYIESGIAEAYVLGALSPGERSQVESDMALYPELVKEVRELEFTLFQYCSTFAINPPAIVKEPVYDALLMATGKMIGSAGSMSKQIPIKPGLGKSTFNFRYAAGLGILIASLAVNYVFWNQGHKEQIARIELENKVTKMQEDQKLLASQLSDFRSSTAMMADTGIQTIVMHTMLKGHPMAATLYWSKTNGETYVAMDALPKPPKGMQYQLWVMQKGKPVSMGMLPDNMANTPVMQKVPMVVTSGDAFAISLEKRGGNAEPTTVYVMGKA